MRCCTRLSRISSFTWSAITISIFRSNPPSSLSSASACGVVRGKPSNTAPGAQSAILRRSSMMRMTMASETRSPFARIASTSRPSGEPDATAARSMSPVESCGRPRSFCRILAWVPLPAPGGPNRTIFKDIQRRAPRSLAFLMRPSYCCAIRWLWICATVSMVTLTTIRIDVPPR